MFALRPITAAAFLLAAGGSVLAQSPNPVCQRLEAQLASLDRGAGGDRANQQRQIDDTINRQQFELDRLNAQARRLECGGSGLFSLFQTPPPQCAGLTRQIEETRGSIDRMRAQLQQSGAGLDTGEQRRSILFALGNNNCGPQYRNASLSAGGGSFLENLFGGNRGGSGGFTNDGSGTYRTICVRTCDGFYYPISFATSSGRFRDDEQACQRSCPASQVSLYTYRNPGEDVAQAVSLDGQSYSQLPNAFRYRQQFDAACSCRAPGQSWTDALKQINEPLQQGDVVVTEKSSKQMSAPRDAKGRPVATVSRSAASSAVLETAKKNDKADKAAAEQVEKDSEANRAEADGKTPQTTGSNAKPQFRSVGPQFIPSR